MFFGGDANMLNEQQIEKYFEEGYVIPDFQLPEKTIEAIQNQHNALLIKHPEYLQIQEQLLLHHQRLHQYPEKLAAYKL